MKRLSCLILILVLSAPFAAGYDVYFKEQFFRLFHAHYIAYPEDSIENIYWLERAQKADFCNPLYALAKIEDGKHWEKYRYLLAMHIELKLIEQHLRLGSKFDKRKAYFYNAPWKDQNLESLKTAESCYTAALAYWDKAKEWALKARAIRFTELPEIQNLMDEAYRIDSGELDYGKIIADELARLGNVRASFEAMDETTY